MVRGGRKMKGRSCLPCARHEDLIDQRSWYASAHEHLPLPSHVLVLLIVEHALFLLLALLLSLRVDMASTSDMVKLL